MLKRFAIKKLIVISISFLVLLIIYLFPSDDEIIKKTTKVYVHPDTIPIYLLDNKNNLLSRFEIIKDNTNEIDDIINNLKEDNNNYIPTNFIRIIPKDTKIINKEIKDDLLIIDFSKELLNIDEDKKEILIESLLYSLTEIDNINKISILVEGKYLDFIPKILDRSYGINKKYDLTSIKNVSKITTYYVNKIDNYTYYTPITMISNNNEDKIKIIIERLKSSPTYSTNLLSYLASSVELLNYEILENTVNLSFNNEILSLDSNKITEEIKYSIALSIKDTYQINKTIFYVDDRLIDVTFL